MGKVKTIRLLAAATATGAGNGEELFGEKYTFFASGTTSAGAGAAVIKVQVSNDDVTYIDLGEISLTLATTASADGFASDAPWKHVRGNVSSISGTDATVNLYAGYIES